MIPITIQIPRNVRLKIDYIVEKCDKEVSGLGTVLFDKAMNAYIVQEIYLLDQEVGAAHTDIDDNAITKAMYELRESEGELCFWWHSHVNMDTFWSHQDHDTIDMIARNGLCVAAVFNKKGSVRGAIAITPDNAPAYKLDNVTVENLDYYDFDLAEMDAEIKAKVRVKAYAPMIGRWDSKAGRMVYDTDMYNKGWDDGMIDDGGFWDDDAYGIPNSGNTDASTKSSQKQMTLLTSDESDIIRNMAHADWSKEPQYMKQKYKGGFAEYLEDYIHWAKQTETKEVDALDAKIDEHSSGSRGAL